MEAAARAGWAIIEMYEQELKLIRAKYGNIRAGSPQTAVMGEHAALVEAAEAGAQRRPMGVDCSALLAGQK